MILINLFNVMFVCVNMCPKVQSTGSGRGSISRTRPGSELEAFLLLPGLVLLSLTANGFNEQRQTRVHRRRLGGPRVIFPPRLCRFLFRGRLFLCGRGLLSAAPLLLLQDALRGLGLPEAGVGGVQVVQVGGEHGLEAGVFDVHLGETDTFMASCPSVNRK